MMIKNKEHIMELSFDKSWHLSQDTDEAKLAEFEFQLWRVFNSFVTWQEDCQRYVCGQPLSAQELAILHLIRMKDQPKNIYELCRLLNRDDPHNVQYSIKKLVKMGLVKAIEEKTGAKLAYQTTNLGIENTQKYRDARHHLLIKLLKNLNLDNLDIEKTSMVLSFLRGIYDEASRLAATYKS